MPKPNPLSYATADMEVAEKISWGYRVIYVFNWIATLLSVGFFLLALMMTMKHDRLANGIGLVVGGPLVFFSFIWAGLPAWYTVLSMERRATNWRAQRRLLVLSLLPFVFVPLGWLVLWVLPKIT